MVGNGTKGANVQRKCENSDNEEGGGGSLITRTRAIQIIYRKKCFLDRDIIHMTCRRERETANGQKAYRIISFDIDLTIW